MNIQAMQGMDIENPFQKDLLKDEKIAWVGRPDPKVLFTAADMYLIPFSLLWGGFTIFWELSVLGLIPFGNYQHQQDLPIFFRLLNIPFMVMGLYLIFGRFFFKTWKKSRTFYAVTNKRVLILTRGLNRSLQSWYLKTIPDINKSEKSDGTGNIVFGKTSFLISIYANTGLDFFKGAYGEYLLAFYDIQEVDKVYGLVKQLKSS